jgi:hypothetical protein
MMTGSRGYMELNHATPQSNKPMATFNHKNHKPTRLEVIASAALAVTLFSAAGYGITQHAKNADAMKRANLATPIVATCVDSLTGRTIAIHQADVTSRPNIIAQAKKTLPCELTPK